MSGLAVNTETLRVDRVVSSFRHQVYLSCSHRAPPSTERLAGVTADIVDAAWEALEGTALACAVLRVWAYCLCGQDVRAVTWDEAFRSLVPVAGLRRGMRIEARFRVDELHSEVGQADGVIAVHAVVSCEGLALEAAILQVVTAVALEPVQSAPPAPPAPPAPTEPPVSMEPPVQAEPPVPADPPALKAHAVLPALAALRAMSRRLARLVRLVRTIGRARRAE